MNLCKRHDLLVDARDRQTDFPYNLLFLFFSISLLLSGVSLVWVEFCYGVIGRCAPQGNGCNGLIPQQKARKIRSCSAHAGL